MGSAMPCKVQNLQRGEPCGKVPNTRRSRYACIVEAHESARKRLERTQPKAHEDRIAGKGFNSLSHYNLVHKFITVPKAVKIPDAKAAVEKEWEKLEKLPAWQMSKVRRKKRHRKMGGQFMLLRRWKYAISRTRSWNPNSKSTEDALCSEVTLCGSYALFAGQGSSASQVTATKVMDCIARLPGCGGQVAGAVSAYTQVKMEDARKRLKLPKSECPDIWIRPPRHK